MRQHGEEKILFSLKSCLIQYQVRYRASWQWVASHIIYKPGGGKILFSIFVLFFASFEKDQRCEATWQWQGKLLLLFLPLFQIQFGFEKDEIFQIQCGFDKERNPFKIPLQKRFWQNALLLFCTLYNNNNPCANTLTNFHFNWRRKWL